MHAQTSPSSLPTQDAPERRATSFDAIRLGAAFTVLVSHHFALAGASERHFGLLGTAGFLAISVFFIISGYFVAASWERDPNLIRYWVKRVRRIFPALIVLVVLTMLVVGPVTTVLPLGDYLGSLHTWTYARNAYLVLGVQYDLPGVFSSNTTHIVNLSLWSLPVELVMYAILSCVAFLAARSARLAYPAVAVLFAVAWWITPEPDGYALTQAFVLGVFFFVGATMHGFDLMRLVSPRLIGICFVLVAIGAFVGGEISQVVVWLALPIVVIGFGSLPSRIGSRVADAGDISYGVYLWAFPIQQLVLLWTDGSVGIWTSMAIAAIVTTVVAALSRQLVERPATRITRRETVAAR